MNLKILKGDLELSYKAFTFPGGEIGIKLDVDDLKFFHNKRIPTVVARIQNSEDFIGLALIKDALYQQGEEKVQLFLPYTPYGRQDRVCDKGESFSLKVFCNILNGLNFDKITIVDPHSNVCSALINNVKVITQFDIVHNWQKLIEKLMMGIILASPDAGSNKKTSILSRYFGHTEFIRADKLRDLATGNIKETVVYAENLEKQHVAIIDDICDGGRTFIELAKVLKSKGAAKIILYVTHGIFSKGTQVLFDNGIDEIWTTNSFKTEFDSKIKLFNIENFLK